MQNPVRTRAVREINQRARQGKPVVAATTTHGLASPGRIPRARQHAGQLQGKRLGLGVWADITSSGFAK